MTKKLKAFLASDLVRRTVKTVGAVLAAQAAGYGTIIPNPPSTAASLGIAGGAGVATFVLNLVIRWFTKTKSADLDALALAVDAAVDARIKEQGLHA